MSRLPIIVGFGGINPAGRSSNHHGYRRLVYGALSESAQQKTLANGTGAGAAWLMANPISQAQWVMEQRREFGRLQRSNVGGRGGGRGGGDRGRGN